jgi:hypothetical protein
MLKKVITLGAALALLLAITQLALAQQNPDQTQPVNSTFNSTFQSPDGSQTPGGGQPPASQSPPPDPTQQSANQPSPPDPAQQSANQSPPPDPTQQNANQPPLPDPAQQSANQSPSPDPTQHNLNGLMHLNAKNELVVDCAALANKLTQLQGAPVGSPQDQAMLTRAEDLSHLCADSGFTPATSTPASSRGAPNVPNPISTNSTQPQQTQDTTTMGG